MDHLALKGKKTTVYTIDEKGQEEGKWEGVLIMLRRSKYLKSLAKAKHSDVPGYTHATIHIRWTKYGDTTRHKDN